MKNLSLLFEYLKRYKLRIGLGLLFVTLSNICSTYIPAVVGRAVDHIGKAGMGMDYILENIIYIVLLTIGSGLFMFLTRQTIIVASRLIEYDLRRDLLDTLEKRKLDFFHSKSTGSLMALANNDIPAAREFLGPAVMYAANAGTTFVFSMYFMLSINPWITLVAILPLPIITISTYILGKKVHLAFRDVQEQFSDLTEQARESISGAKVVRAYNRGSYEKRLFDVMSRKYMKKNLKLARYQSLMQPLLMVLVGFSLITVLAFGGYMVIQGQSTIGELTQFFMYLSMLIWPVAAIGWITNIIQRASASSARLQTILHDSAATDYSESGTTPVINGAIEFNGVGLKYSPESAEVLSGIDLNIGAGEMLGVVGPVGSGKSSLVNLISALFLPSDGKLIISGHEIGDINVHHLRKHIGSVQQDPFLFSMTIEDNIRFGNRSASSEEVKRAAEIACLDEEINTFEKGYATMLGERGVTLSGGQKQRLAIARAVLRNPTILILDDSLSAVDTSTEERLLKNLKEFMQNRTTVIISHRMSAVRACDKIITIKDGKICESGTHEQLIAIPEGYYSETFKLQELEQEIAGL